MKGSIVSKIAAIAVFLAFTAGLNAQVVNTLVRSGDAVSAGTSGASVAMDANAFAIDNNAASMILSGGTMAAAGSYSILQPSAVKMGLTSVAGYYKISSKLAAGTDVKYINYDAYDVVAADGRTVSRYTPSEIAFAAGIAYGFTDNLSVGLAAKYGMLMLSPESKSGAFGIDLSAMYSANALSAGVAVRNLGSSMTDVRAGAAYKLSFLNTYAQLEYLAGAGIMAAAGAEYSYNEMVFARAGFHYGGQAAIPTSASLGAGVKLKGISADVAYILAGKNIGNSLCLCIGYSF